MKFYRCPGPVKVVSFDLDDTLYDNAPVIGAAEVWFANLLTDRYQLPALCREVSFWKEEKLKTQERQPELANDVTLLRAQALVDTFLHLHCPLKGGLDEGLALTAEFVVQRSKIKVPQSSLELIAYLRKFVPVAAVSNGNVNLQGSGLDGAFDFELRPSVQEGCRRKPYPDLYLKLAAKYQVSPGEILHVGDECGTDLLGACRAGAQAAWLKGGIAGRCATALLPGCLPMVELDDLQELRAFFH